MIGSALASCCVLTGCLQFDLLHWHASKTETVVVFKPIKAELGGGNRTHLAAVVER